MKTKINIRIEEIRNDGKEPEVRVGEVLIESLEPITEVQVGAIVAKFLEVGEKEFKAQQNPN